MAAGIFIRRAVRAERTIKAYVALRLAGDSPGSEHMRRAAKRVHELGGLEASNSYTRLYLALVGAVGWDMVPAVPPELMLLPNWFAINIYEMSSWTRGIVIPLDDSVRAQAALQRARRHLRRRAVPRSVAESARPSIGTSNCSAGGISFWRLDRGLKLYERVPWKPLRQRALRQAREWMLEHLERSEGLAAIYPAMMNAIFALVALGHSPDDPLTAREIGEFSRFEIEEGDTIRVQPCVSPVWDTAIAMVALEEAGLPPNHPALVEAASWLLENQIGGPGDWMLKTPGVMPGGWAFEFRNDFYPDVDDTAFVLMALQRVDYPDKARMEAAMRRGLAWLLAMQNDDGGWGAFDHNNDRQFLCQIPFADHNAMIDPSTADVTARVVECLGRYGWPATHPVIQRAVRFLLKDQTEEGPWFGRWGVNYVYGTSGVLRALETVALTAREYCQRAVEWLRSVQNPDGGFGESIASYYDPALKGQGREHGVADGVGTDRLAGREPKPEDPAIARAVKHLVEQQQRTVPGLRMNLPARISRACFI